MIDRPFAAHFALAAAAVIAAGFAAWMPRSGASKDGVILIPGKPERLESIALHEDAYDVVVSRDKDDAERIKVSVTRKVKKPAVVAGTEGTAGTETTPEDPPAPPPTKIYPGSERAKELFETMAPLIASRSLGNVPPEKLAGLGLADPKMELVLSYNGNDHVVELGQATYGSGDRYARNAKGEIFLLAARKIGGLRNGAASMLERRAIAIDAEAIRRVTITAGARNRELIQRYGEDRKKAFFADPKVPDEKLQQISNWLDRIMKLRIADVGQDQPSGPASVAIEFFNGKGSLGKITLWQPGKKFATATSSLFYTPITISKANAEAILRDLDAVLEEGR